MSLDTSNLVTFYDNNKKTPYKKIYDSPEISKGHFSDNCRLGGNVREDVTDVLKRIKGRISSIGKKNIDVSGLTEQYQKLEKEVTATQKNGNENRPLCNKIVIFNEVVLSAHQSVFPQVSRRSTTNGNTGDGLIAAEFAFKGAELVLKDLGGAGLGDLGGALGGLGHCSIQ